METSATKCQKALYILTAVISSLLNTKENLIKPKERKIAFIERTTTMAIMKPNFAVTIDIYTFSH